MRQSLSPSTFRSLQKLRLYAVSPAQDILAKGNHDLEGSGLPAMRDLALDKVKDTESALEEINNEIQALRHYIQGPGQSMAHMKYQLSAIRKDIAAIRPSPWQQKPYVCTSAKTHVRLP